MSGTGLVWDPVYLQHDTGVHVENALRVVAIMSHLDKLGLKARLPLIAPRAAYDSELCMVHSEKHIARVQEVCARSGWLYPDTPTSPESYQASLYAVGGAIVACEAVITGEMTNAFAVVRPAGHHSARDQAMGFCFFNNVALAARYLQQVHLLKRIAIIDFDVHHGNGTQDTFYDDPGIFVFSVHEHPLFPGTGMAEETGEGDGFGTTLNVPLPENCSDAEYRRVFYEVLMPSVRRYQPEFILVSAGYDAHWADPLAFMRLSTTAYGRMTRVIKRLAEELCEGRLVAVLEGGYHKEATSYAVGVTLESMLGAADSGEIMHPPPEAKKPPPDISELLARVREIHRLD